MSVDKVCSVHMYSAQPMLGQQADGVVLSGKQTRLVLMCQPHEKCREMDTCVGL